MLTIKGIDDYLLDKNTAAVSVSLSSRQSELFKRSFCMFLGMRPGMERTWLLQTQTLFSDIRPTEDDVTYTTQNVKLQP